MPKKTTMVMLFSILISGVRSHAALCRPSLDPSSGVSNTVPVSELAAGKYGELIKGWLRENAIDGTGIDLQNYQFAQANDPGSGPLVLALKINRDMNSTEPWDLHFRMDLPQFLRSNQQVLMFGPWRRLQRIYNLKTEFGPFGRVLTLANGATLEIVRAATFGKSGWFDNTGTKTVDFYYRLPGQSRQEVAARRAEEQIRGK